MLRKELLQLVGWSKKNSLSCVNTLLINDIQSSMVAITRMALGYKVIIDSSVGDVLQDYYHFWVMFTEGTRFHNKFSSLLVAVGSLLVSCRPTVHNLLADS